MRAIWPEDEALVREMLADLSEETLRVRFFTIQEITHDFLMQSCNIDYDRQIAIVAESDSGGRKRAVGGIRLIYEPDSGKAQFAILVHDDWRQMGLRKADRYGHRYLAGQGFRRNIRDRSDGEPQDDPVVPKTRISCKN